MIVDTDYSAMDDYLDFEKILADFGEEYSNYSIEDFYLVSQDYEQEERWLPKTEEIIFIVVFVILIILGLAGNGLVCFIVLRKGK